MKTILLLLFSLVLLQASLASGAAGDPDLTFGTKGRVNVPAGASHDRLMGVAVQPDGKIVATSFFGEVVRVDTNGVLDPTFGVGGIVNLRDVFAERVLKAIALQADGKIVVAGFQRVNLGIVRTFVLVRLNTDGSLDTTFDNDGYVVTPLPNIDEGYANALLIQPDGKILAAGNARDSSSPRFQFALARYLPNGSLDTTFNLDGVVTTSISSSCCEDSRIEAIAFGSGGITAAGNVGFGAIARYNLNGSLNTTFNGTGIVTDQPVTPYATAIQPDGKIAIAGFGYIEGRPSLSLARFNSSGSLDTTFGDGGIRHTDFDGNRSVAFAMALQSDGKMIAVGGSSLSPSSGFLEKVVLSRYNRYGSLDRSFSGDGKISEMVGEGSHARACAIQPDGKIVVAGGFGVEEDPNFYIARYHAATPSNHFDFDGDWRSDLSVFRPSDQNWYLNRSSDGFAVFRFGLATDTLVPADYDDDGKTDIAVFRDGDWWWMNSHDNTVRTLRWGLADDVPVPFNFNGDRMPELAVYRGGEWWFLNTTTGQSFFRRFGLPGDRPVTAGYNGDGITDSAVYRSGEWHRQIAGFYSVVQFGLPDDKPIPADYDGDGKTDIAVYRDGTWYLLQTTVGFDAFRWGLPSDTPVPADYDGDGKADAAVFRDGTWYVLKSTGGTSIQHFGLKADQPLPAAYIH